MRKRARFRRDHAGDARAAGARARRRRSRVARWTPQPVNWAALCRALPRRAVCTASRSAMYPYFELAEYRRWCTCSVSTIAGSAARPRARASLAAVANVARVRLLLRSAAIHVRRRRCAVPRHILGHADRDAWSSRSSMASVRQQTRVAGARERRTALLYAMSRELAATRGVSSMARVAVTHVAEVFDCKAVILLPDAKGRLRLPAKLPLDMFATRRGPVDRPMGGRPWPARRPGLRHAAGGAGAVSAAERRRSDLGVLAVLPANRRRVLLPEQRHLLETFAGQIGLAMERAQLAEAAEAARVAAETESLRNTLLASISHDLRTPLAVIAGAGSTLADPGARTRRRQRAASSRARSRPAHVTCRTWSRTCST